ncbi:MAG: hypothetical protein GY875_13220 [Gammaproteobacteria bacterium]|nr:hypothetical protein [Gammaproteobacteria bacterium]
MNASPLKIRYFLATLAISAALLSGCKEPNSKVTVQKEPAYESDEGFPESPRRRQQAFFAIREATERAPATFFRFPEDALAQGGVIYGIDVSHHNGDIEWHYLPKNSIVFSVAKATEGINFKDRKFEGNWRKMQQLRDDSLLNGEPRFFRGAYHFFTPSDPERQAREFLAAIGKLDKYDLPPTLDLEWTSFERDRWERYSGEEITQRALVWLEIVGRETGKKPIIYTNAAWWSDRGIIGSKFSDYPLWIADYRKSSIGNMSPVSLPAGLDYWRLWQFTDLGFVKGVDSEGLDVNIFYGTKAEFLNLLQIEPN